jgi:hypothetical protein
MKIQDIPVFMGRSAASLAADLQISKQALFSYTSGKRGKPSKFLGDLLAFCQLNREEVIFSDPFDHPEGDDPQNPVYWCALALEALHEAKQRGLSEEDAKGIAKAIRNAVEKIIE